MENLDRAIEQAETTCWNVANSQYAEQVIREAFATLRQSINEAIANEKGG